MKAIALFLLYVILLTGCRGTSSEAPVARVYDKYMYTSDLLGIVSANSSKEDSINTIRKYIDNWVREQLILHKAEENLSDEQKDFTKELESYKTSLIIYQYEKELVNQKLDTAISDKEVEEFYLNNKKNFELKDNIVRGMYMVFPINTPNLKKIKKYISAEGYEDRQVLEQYCKKYATSYSIDDQTWMLFNEILKVIPIQTYNQEQFLQHHNYIESEDDQYVYIAFIKDFMIKEGVSPLAYEKKNIKSIILNKRKIQLINAMQEELYKEGVKKNNFEVYN